MNEVGERQREGGREKKCVSKRGDSYRDPRTVVALQKQLKVAQTILVK